MEHAGLGMKDATRKDCGNTGVPGYVKIGFDVHALALQSSHIICLSSMLFMLVASKIDLTVKLFDPQVRLIPVISLKGSKREEALLKCAAI